MMRWRSRSKRREPSAAGETAVRHRHERRRRRSALARRRLPASPSSGRYAGRCVSLRVVVRPARRVPPRVVAPAHPHATRADRRPSGQHPHRHRRERTGSQPWPPPRAKRPGPRRRSPLAASPCHAKRDTRDGRPPFDRATTRIRIRRRAAHRDRRARGLMRRAGVGSGYIRTSKRSTSASRRAASNVLAAISSEANPCRRVSGRPRDAPSSNLSALSSRMCCTLRRSRCSLRSTSSATADDPDPVFELIESRRLTRVLRPATVVLVAGEQAQVIRRIRSSDLIQTHTEDHTTQLRQNVAIVCSLSPPVRSPSRRIRTSWSAGNSRGRRSRHSVSKCS